MWSWKDGLYRKLVGTRFSDISAVCMMGEKHLVVASERRGVAASVIDLETHRTIVSFFQFDNAGHRGKDMIWLRDRTVLVTTLSSWVYICEFPHSVCFVSMRCACVGVSTVLWASIDLLLDSLSPLLFSSSHSLFLSPSVLGRPVLHLAHPPRLSDLCSQCQLRPGRVQFRLCGQQGEDWWW